MLEFDEIITYFRELNEMIERECKKQGLLKKDLAEMIGYKTQSGFTNCISRGSIKIKELAMVSAKLGQVPFALYPERLREYLGNLSVYKVFVTLYNMKFQDEMYAEYKKISGGVND